MIEFNLFVLIYYRLFNTALYLFRKYPQPHFVKTTFKQILVNMEKSIYTVEISHFLVLLDEQM